jgi:hypothetical protein
MSPSPWLSPGLLIASALSFFSNTNGDTQNPDHFLEAPSTISGIVPLPPMVIIASEWVIPLPNGNLLKVRIELFFNRKQNTITVLYCQHYGH